MVTVPGAGPAPEMLLSNEVRTTRALVTKMWIEDVDICVTHTWLIDVGHLLHIANFI